MGARHRRSRPPSWPVWAAIAAVIAGAGAVLAWAASQPLNWLHLGALSVLFLACDRFAVPLHTKDARVSLAYAVGLGSVVILGPAGAAIVGATAIITPQPITSPIKRLFNGAQFALCGFASGVVFHALGGDAYRPRQAQWVEHVLGPFLGALVAYVFINLALTAGVLALARRPVVAERLRQSGELVGACLGYGLLGLLIGGLWPSLGIAAAVLVLLPLLVARWALEQAYAQQQAHAATLAALCKAVETKDLYTRGHSERVSRGSVMAAEEMGMRPDRVAAIRYAGMLHDVGKLGVPTRVLQKSGDLTEEEFAAIQLHPMRGLEIVREIGFLDEALGGIMHHHEKIDGRGYPMGLVGDEIPEFARVIGVADAFDSMTSTRSYRAARSPQEAVAELRRCAGTHFDPVIVEAFIRALERKGWDYPGPVTPTGGQVAQRDHDDPDMPLRATRGDGSLSG